MWFQDGGVSHVKHLHASGTIRWEAAGHKPLNNGPGRLATPRKKQHLLTDKLLRTFNERISPQREVIGHLIAHYPSSLRNRPAQDHCMEKKRKTTRRQPVTVYETYWLLISSCLQTDQTWSTQSPLITGNELHTDKAGSHSKLQLEAFFWAWMCSNMSKVFFVFVVFAAD